jgi:hypothetical protein
MEKIIAPKPSQLSVITQNTIILMTKENNIVTTYSIETSIRLYFRDNGEEPTIITHCVIMNKNRGHIAEGTFEECYDYILNI